MPQQPNMAAKQGRLRPLKKRDSKPKPKPKPKAKPKKPTPPSAAAPPKYGPLRRRAESEADLRYREPILQAQALPTTAGAWFDQYKTSLAQAQGATAARYAQAQQQIGGLTPTVGPAAGADTPEGAQAAQSRGIMNQGFGNLLTTQGTAQQDYLTGRETVGAAQKLQTQLEAQKMLGELVKERGAYVQTRKGELKDDRHRKRLENKAFGLDVAKVQADVTSDAADRRQDKRENRQSRRDDQRENRQDRQDKNREVITSGVFSGFTKSQVRSMSPGQKQRLRDAAKAPGAGGKSRFTATQQATARKDFRKVYRDVKNNDNGIQGYGKDITKALTGAGADSLLVRAAVQLYKTGKVGGGVSAALYRDYGINVKKRKAAKRPKPYSPPASPGSDAAQG